MKVKELIKELEGCNPEAKVNVVAHCRCFDFTISASGADGVDRSNCYELSFYVDDLCTNDQSNNFETNN